MGNQTGQLGYVTITPIYWAPAGYVYTASYKTIINRYLHDVAVASRQNSNVFSVSTQYYQQLLPNPIQTLQYAVTAGAELDDTAAFPTQGLAGDCTAASGFAICITDAQLQSQLSAFLAAAAKPMNDGNLYMVFFPKTVETCFKADGQPNQACSSNIYCAYHSGLGTTSTNTILYANEPFPAPLNGCADPWSGPQAPNGDSYADAEISIVSHEANEAITDSSGAWFDATGNENGDECAFTYGNPLGSTGVVGDLLNSGTNFNQLINGGHYYTQDEFSNQDFAIGSGDLNAPLSALGGGVLVLGCVQREELPTAAFMPPATILAGTPASFDGSASSDLDNVTALSYSWHWGDGTADSAGATPSHTYNSVGAFTVILTVTDGDSWTSSISHPLNVIAPTLPGQPTGVNAAAGNGQVGLSWTAPTSTGGASITGYSVTPYSGGIAQTSVPTMSAGPSFTVSSLSNGTTYTFTVAAINSVGTGPASAPSNPVIPNASVPGQPTGLGASAGNAQVSITWTTPSTNGGAAITSYSLTPYVGSTSQTAIQTGSASPSVTVTGLVNGTTYTFTVAATNSAGTGPASAISNPVTPITVPGAPIALVATAGVGAATLTWTPPASNGGSAITGYTVNASTGPVVEVSGTSPQAIVAGLTTAAVTFTVTAANNAGTGLTSIASNSVTPLPGGTYRPVVPKRVLDTRSGIGSLVAGQTLDLQVTGQGNVPSTGVSSVVLNVTVTDTTASSYLSVWPQGTVRPVVSNLNWVSGKTVANLVEVAVGTTGKVSFFNPAGSTDVIADVQGYVGDNSDSFSRAGLFNPLSPGRDLDTRSGLGAPAARLGPGATLNVTISNVNGVPSAGVSAVILNVTAIDPSAGGYLTVWPAGATRPTASNLNFLPHQIVPNRVMVGVGTNGQVSIYNPAGTVDVIADVNGWFTDISSAAGGSAFIGVLPGRIFDTRGTPTQPAIGPFPPGGILILGPAPTNHSAMVLNVTAVTPTSAGYLTLYPDNPADPNRTPPTASDLNFAPGDVVPNLTVVKLGPNSDFDTYNPAGFTDVVYDEDGYYGAIAPAPPPWLGAARFASPSQPGSSNTVQPLQPDGTGSTSWLIARQQIGRLG